MQSQIWVDDFLDKKSFLFGTNPSVNKKQSLINPIYDESISISESCNL